MAEIQAFRGLRYDLGHVGALADVVAPPYDVIGPEFQDQLYKLHPANVIRLILNRGEPGDDDTSNRYTRAAQFLKNWRSEGVLAAEPRPAVYVYHQVFDFEGHSYTRRGFLARMRLERFGEGKIFPHEETLAGPKADRLLLTKACRANLSPVFGIYPDPETTAQSIVERVVANTMPLETKDHLGVIHRLWPVSDDNAISALAAALAPKPVFIADGHHRYETACNYRDELAAQGTLTPQHAANYVLMMFIGMNDPGLIVFPTHRLFRGLPPLKSEELAKALGDAFTSKVVAQGRTSASTVWEEIETGDSQGTLGLYTKADDRWTLATITEAGRRRMREVAADHGDEWQQLGVSLLHRLVVDTLLKAKDLPRPEYVHQVQEVVDWLGKGEFELAALVMPATVENIRAISQTNERMPAKSTYFYPKLLSGLVINPLE